MALSPLPPLPVQTITEFDDAGVQVPVWREFWVKLLKTITSDSARLLDPSIVAGLPAAASNQGTRGFVTDATQTLTAGIGAVVVGGGANKVPVVSDGAAWRIG